MAETVPVVGAGFMDALYAYAAEARDVTQAATALGLEYLQEGLRQQAAQQERWAALAPHIETFSQDGRLVVGIRGGPFASEAEQAEYGDASHPPAPLFRNSEQLQREARKRADDYIQQVMGRVVL